jgi:hypothetical protein
MLRLIALISCLAGAAVLVACGTNPWRVFAPPPDAGSPPPVPGSGPEFFDHRPPLVFQPEDWSSGHSPDAGVLLGLLVADDNADSRRLLDGVVATAVLRPVDGGLAQPLDRATGINIPGYQGPYVALTSKAPLAPGWYEFSAGPGLASSVNLKNGADTLRIRFLVGSTVQVNEVTHVANGGFKTGISVQFSQPVRLAPGATVDQSFRVTDLDGGGETGCQLRTDGGRALNDHWSINCGQFPDHHRLRVTGMEIPDGGPMERPFERDFHYENFWGGSHTWTREALDGF